MQHLPVAEIFVSWAERIAVRLGRPRIRALHLPPKGRSTAKEAEFCAIELDDGSIGWSYIWLDETDRLMNLRICAEDFVGQTAFSLAEGYLRADPMARALGFAAINALSQGLFTRAQWLPAATVDSLGHLDPQAGEHVGMVGLFSRLVPRVVEAKAKLTVLELKPELAEEGQGYRVTLDPRALAPCQKVVSTCTVLLNGTLDAVLKACRHSTYFAVVGPTAGCIPDPLFERGVDSLGGRRVVDLEGFTSAIRAGEKWGSFTRKYAIARENYPGIEWLLKRVGE